MSESVQESIAKQGVQLEHLANELKQTNTKIDKLAEIFNKHEVIQTDLKHIERRIGQLEQLRWWLGSTIVFAVLGAVLKLVVFS